MNGCTTANWLYGLCAWCSGFPSAAFCWYRWLCRTPVMPALWCWCFIPSAFSLRGLLRRGWNTWFGHRPQGGRGQFYAVKSIIGTCVSSAATLALGRVLDYYLEQGQGYTGFLIIGIVSLSLTVVDAVLLASVRENPVKFTSKMRPADILRPVRDPAYRPLLFTASSAG
ncbi:hypothetical protein NIA69_18500 [Gemmiger formicilis]|nr:hypothetical protein [Gemmiger formicilis]MCO7110712.1 hypothetical protein [Gemmiger formicilis]